VITDNKQETPETNQAQYDHQWDTAFVRLKIFGCKYANILIDTGSGGTIVNERFLARHNIPFQQYDKQNCRNLFTANNSTIEQIGRVLFKFEMEDQTFETTAAVCKNLSPNIILGFDSLNKFDAVLDMHQGLINFKHPNGKICKAHFVRRDELLQLACLSDKVFIPRGSEVTAKLQLKPMGIDPKLLECKPVDVQGIAMGNFCCHGSTFSIYCNKEHLKQK